MYYLKIMKYTKKYINKMRKRTDAETAPLAYLSKRVLAHLRVLHESVRFLVVDQCLPHLLHL